MEEQVKNSRENAPEKLSEAEQLRYYREAYFLEKQRSTSLAGRLSDANAQVEELSEKLANIKGSFAWKLSKPLRDTYHQVNRVKQRVGSYGSIGEIARKIKSEMIERRVRRRYGTRSFPSPEEAKKQRETRFSRNIRFSILVPLYNTPRKFLMEMLDSVQAQTYENWQLCLADGSDKDHAFVGELCREYASKDPRICYRKLEENQGISGNTNECLKMAEGEYIGLFDHDDVLHPCVLYEYMLRICEEDADYLYCDETTFRGNRTIDDMLVLHFKPDFAIDNLRGNNYICHFSAFDRKLLEGMELFRSQFDGSQDHDMILRLTSRAKHVVHVPKMLYYWRSHKDSVASGINAKNYAVEAARNAIADHLRTNGFQGFEITSTKAFATIFRIQYEIQGSPKISIVIPNRDHANELSECVESILKLSSYYNYEIIIVENNSVTKEIETCYKSLEKHENIRVVRYEGAFNYAAVNNFGVSFASGDYLVLLNNDTKVISVDWMEELLMYAQREDVGAVGAKLYYRDNTIQHAGIVLGLGAHRTAGHTHYRMARTFVGYMGKLCYAQDVSAVTGACLMVKTALYRELGGLDEDFAIALNDVDFCLRLRERGLLNVWNPYCELYHFESASRGKDNRGEQAERYEKECALFREKWKAALEAGDPYYNPNFSLDRSDYSLKIQL